MHGAAQMFFAVQEQSEEGRFHEESEHTFHGQRLSDHASSEAREMRPVGAELKFHGNASDNTDHEVDTKDLRPETRGSIVALVLLPHRHGLEHHDERCQSHGQLREKIVVSDSERKVQSMYE